MNFRHCWLAVALTLWVCCPPPGASAARLQRWVYYPVDLWVEANITTLTGVLYRAAQSGYTHVLLSDSKFSHAVMRSSRVGDWGALTNFTSPAAIGRCVDSTISNRSVTVYRAVTAP